MSGVFQQVMNKLGITQYKSSAYHPQSQGALERWHQTLKTMMGIYCFETGTKTSHFINAVIHPRDRKRVGFSHAVHLSIVGTHSVTSIWFRNKYTGRTPTTVTWLDEDWDEGIHLLLFAARESVQESLGFSPFELVFGHTVRGPLKLLKGKLLSSGSEPVNLLQYVSDFCTKLARACELARANLTSSQKSMKKKYEVDAVE